MNTAEVINFEDYKTNKDDGMPGDLNWLLQLGVGSVFTCEMKSNGASFIQQTYCVTAISDKYSYVLMELTSKESIKVNPIRFCNIFSKVEVLRTREEYLQELKVND